MFAQISNIHALFVDESVALNAMVRANLSLHLARLQRESPPNYLHFTLPIRGGPHPDSAVEAAERPIDAEANIATSQTMSRRYYSNATFNF